MRQPLRVPILLNIFNNKDVLNKFLNTEDDNIVNNIIEKYTSIMLEWNTYPDYRFGQMLSCMGFVTKEIENHIWNIEESNWLVSNEYCNIEDISFWGVNYYKNGKQRKTIKFKLLRDLDIDHIKNIIIFFEKYNSLDKLNKKYLEYFNKRIENGN